MADPKGILDDRFLQQKCCVVIPTYNNEKTLQALLDQTLALTTHVIVVNDGSTDSTAGILDPYAARVTIITFEKNKGKGMAIRSGFSKAVELSYDHAITIDSDGQHFPSDFPKFLDRLKEEHEALIVGARNMQSENVPGGSSFGNKFSNFWFQVETGIKLPDTQSGYRLYPVRRLEKLRFFTSRFEFEIEVLVKAAWKNIKVVSIPVQVYYAKPGERVSHFRPGKDFARISLLNTYLVLLAFAWYKPLHMLKGLSPGNIKGFIKKHFFNQEESVLKKSCSVGVGIFFGIIPIWGYQLISAIAAAYFFKLNKAIVILTANISIPPLLPFILIGSLKTGELITGEEANLSLSNISLETIKLNLYTYVTGACFLAVISALFFTAVTFVALTLLRKPKKISRTI